VQTVILDRRLGFPPYPPAGELGAWEWVWGHAEVEFLEGRAYAGEAGWSLERRTVPNALAILVLEGRSRWRVGDRSLGAGPGDLLFIPEGVPHAAEAPAAPVHFLSVHFTARVLGAKCLLLVLGFPPILEGGEYAAGVRELVRLAIHRPAGWRPRGRALLMDLLLRTVHEHPGEFRPLQVQEGRALRVLCPAFQLLEAAEGRVRVEELAKAAACSPTYLRRLFRAGLGMSPQQYLLQRRLQRAADLLRTTDHTVQQVAERCGFESLSHFHRCFRTRFGCTPLEFRSRLAQPP
jgi:AraC-like DNA-binding protein